MTSDEALSLLGALLLARAIDRPGAAPGGAAPVEGGEAARFRLLSPTMQRLVAELLATVLQRTGVRLVLGSTVRTLQEQEALYRAGKSRVHGRAAPHVRGVAVDLYEPADAPEGTRAAWHAIARALGWRGMYSWDQGHIERRDV
jgi:hypothetical protein